MGIRTLLKYLVGNRQAILAVAADRRAVWIGALFVLAAGFAREYDAKDLVHEPWWLLVPFAASIVLSLALFCLLGVGMAFRERFSDFLRTYPRLLGLFWMTAPLALLYAVPYERLLSPGGATSAKLWTLAIVSGWRVLLMIRVTSVVYGSKLAAFPVMFLTDAAALFVVAAAPQPVINFMGSIQHTASEEAIITVILLIGCTGMASALGWIIGMLCVAIRRPLRLAFPAPTQSRSRRLPIAAVACILVWLPILPFTQPQQQLRRQAEHLLRQGSIKEAVALLSAHREEDLPPHWDPPPRVGYRESKPAVLDVMDVIIATEAAPWVRRVYLEKMERVYLYNPGFYNGGSNKTDWQHVRRILSQVPEGPMLIQNYAKNISIIEDRFVKIRAATRPDGSSHREAGPP